MFALGKTLADFTNLFSPNSFKSNVDIILNYFMTNVEFKFNWLNSIPLKNVIYVQIQMTKNSLINEIISKSKDYFVLEIKERINEQRG